MGAVVRQVLGRPVPTLVMPDQAPLTRARVYHPPTPLVCVCRTANFVACWLTPLPACAASHQAALLAQHSSGASSRSRRSEHRSVTTHERRYLSGTLHPPSPARLATPPRPKPPTPDASLTNCCGHNAVQTGYCSKTETVASERLVSVSSVGGARSSRRCGQVVPRQGGCGWALRSVGRLRARPSMQRGLIQLLTCLCCARSSLTGWFLPSPPG